MSGMLRWGMSLPVPVFPHGLRASKKLTSSKLMKAISDVDLARDVPMDNGETAKNEGRFVFECSAEVANKVGSIYTVLRSKAAETTEELGEQYCMLGPLNEERLKLEVEILEPSNSAATFALQHLRNSGFRVEYGKWLIDGYPNVVLFDVNSARWKMDEWKREMWERCKIGIPWEDHECSEACVFGFLAAVYIQKFVEAYSKTVDRALCVAHFHDWQSATGLILSRLWKTDVSTVFTMHATQLGRHLSTVGADMYNKIDTFDAEKEACARNMYHRYCIERIAVSMAHVFTTVSDVTGFEATHLMKRKPDILTPNGLNVVKFSALHEFQNLHSLAKEKIHDFIRGHFHGHYDFDLEKTLYVFTAGRYEFKNKGGDFFIQALARLNALLKASMDSRCKGVTVVAFIIYPAPTNSFNVESLKGQAVSKQLRETIAKIRDNIASRMYECCLKGNLPSDEEFLAPEERIQLKRCILSLKRDCLPPICTHNMLDDVGDPVLNALRQARLINMRADRVKVIFHPEFLSSVSPLMHLDYEDFVRGCHMGVFPSYYEPWGYTPAECTVMGVPSVTTNLSGFGSFVQAHVRHPQAFGVYVIDRLKKATEEAVEELAQYLYEFTLLTRRQRSIMRNRTERLSEFLDWKNLGWFYREARRMALKETNPDIVQTTQDSDGSDEKLASTQSCSLVPSSEIPCSLTPSNSGEDDEDSDLEEQEEFEEKHWAEN